MIGSKSPYSTEMSPGQVIVGIGAGVVGAVLAFGTSVTNVRADALSAITPVPATLPAG